MDLIVGVSFFRVNDLLPARLVPSGLITRLNTFRTRQKAATSLPWS